MSRLDDKQVDEIARGIVHGQFLTDHRDLAKDLQDARAELAAVRPEYEKVVKALSGLAKARRRYSDGTDDRSDLVEAVDACLAAATGTTP